MFVQISSHRSEYANFIGRANSDSRVIDKCAMIMPKQNNGMTANGLELSENMISQFTDSNTLLGEAASKESKDVS